MIGLSVYCWQHARLTVDFLLAGFCLALPFTFDALLAGLRSVGPTLALTKMPFWAGWLAIAITVVICSTL